MAFKVYNFSLQQIFIITVVQLLRGLILLKPWPQSLQQKTQRARFTKTPNHEHKINCTPEKTAHSVSLHLVRAPLILHTQTKTGAKVEETAVSH